MKVEKVKIYHNPACGTSRNVLALLKFAGLDLEVIEYLQTPPSREELLDLLRGAGISAQEALRTNVDAYEKHFAGRENLTEEEIIDAMMVDPILINRPFVETSKGIRLARPSERVLEILPVNLPGPFVKEEGQVIEVQSDK